jgi:hypothetical protein
MKKNVRKLQCFKKTQDNWCPNFPNNQVLLSCCPVGEKFRVSVWGNDDCGMEKDFDTRKEALRIYNSLRQEEFVNFQTVKFWGFNGA